MNRNGYWNHDYYVTAKILTEFGVRSHIVIECGNGAFGDHRIEIGIAAIDPIGNNLILGECKYHKDPIEPDVFYALENEPQNVMSKNNHRKAWFFSASMAALLKWKNSLNSEMI